VDVSSGSAECVEAFFGGELDEQQEAAPV